MVVASHYLLVSAVLSWDSYSASDAASLRLVVPVASLATVGNFLLVVVLLYVVVVC